MRVIPVIDLMQGQVVRGVAGRRSEYRPVESQIAGDAWPATVARAFVDHFGFDTVYVADLDAIVHRQPNVESWKEITDAGLALSLDAGVGTPQLAAAIHDRLASIDSDSTFIIGLESLVTPANVVDIVKHVGAPRVVFSLDLTQGRPLTNIRIWKDETPIGIARWVVRAGIQRLLVLDLADVGVGEGPRTLDLCREIRREFPTIELIAGGGVRGIDDLQALACAGCDAALVASALHDGRLTPEDIRQIEGLPRGG
jgi:phosphoribosylformimino-5-aminoimidazole carboxamide ribotide isomerase